MDTPTPENFLTIESRDDAVVARFSCPLILGGQIAEDVTKRMTSLIAELGARPLLMDLANVRSLNSLMLGKLVQINNAAKAAGTRLLLFNVATNVRKILEVTRLDMLLSLHEDEQTALKSK